MDFSYRIQIKLPSDKGIKYDKLFYLINNTEIDNPIKIQDFKGKINITNSTDLVFCSSGFKNYEDAENEGEKVLNAIILSFIKLRKGIDYGVKGSSFEITQEGIEHFQKQLNVERLLVGGLGLQIYETYPEPRFLDSDLTIKVHSPIDKLEQVFLESKTQDISIKDKELVAIHLFNSSFFEKFPESRFLLLVMTIEVLIDCTERPKNACEHVNDLIQITKTNTNLNKSDRDSILGALSCLKRKSIGQSGRDLIKKYLNGEKYYGKLSDKFFTYCYSLRSELVHGNSELKNTQELGIVSNDLEKMVSDLLVNILIKKSA